MAHNHVIKGVRRLRHKFGPIGVAGMEYLTY